MSSLPGVISSTVGYAGGNATERAGRPPTYGSVCSRKNTYTEAVRLRFDPGVLSFEELMLVFVNDPRIQRVKSGGEALSPFFSRRQTQVAVWAQDDSQAKIARCVLDEALKHVPVLPPGNWYDAEEHHQHFIAEEKSLED